VNEIIWIYDADLSGAIRAVQQPRSNFQFTHFVVGQHDTEARRWLQCVLELQIKIQNVKRAAIQRRKTERKIAAIRAGDEDARDDSELFALDLQKQDLAVLGAIRETERSYA
jgi:hypothetical protein